MNRKVLDRLLSASGLVMVAVMLIAATLLFWAHSFVDNQVHSQLAAQQVYFPAQGSKGLADPKIGPYLNKYAGQQLVNGAQAQAYADHFIAVHVAGIADGKTYAQLSTQAQANPTDTVLAGKVQSVFRGETLRSMLLNAYAFWKMGQIALWAAIAALVGAGLMLVVSVLGLVHGRRVSVLATGRVKEAPSRSHALPQPSHV
jgi:hypothetical protein